MAACCNLTADSHFGGHLKTNGGQMFPLLFEAGLSLAWNLPSQLAGWPASSGDLSISISLPLGLKTQAAMPGFS